MRSRFASVFALIALVSTTALADPFARARNDIDKFCEMKADCIAAQRKQMGHFVTMMAGFEDPGNRNARECMTIGKRGKYIDWTAASSCLRKRVKGKPIGGRSFSPQPATPR